MSKILFGIILLVGSMSIADDATVLFSVKQQTVKAVGSTGYWSHIHSSSVANCARFSEGWGEWLTNGLQKFSLFFDFIKKWPPK